MFAQRLLDKLDRPLDGITSYRLVLYFLYVVFGWAIVIAASTNKLSFEWYEIAASVAVLLAVCRLVNYTLSRALEIPRNSESDLITALILGLILAPATTQNGFLVLGLAGAFAMAAKYILVINRRHIFNPAAVGAFLSGALFHHYASWWVGSGIITPIVIVGGVLILRKMKRFTMAGVFLATYLVVILVNLSLGQSTESMIHHAKLLLWASPVLFFAFIMLIEPLTTPSKLSRYLPYSILVGLLYGTPKLRLSPEQALLIGNGFSYIIAPYKTVRMQFIRKIKEAEGIYSFHFKPDKALRFSAGQYLEWTIPASNSDGRGNRRYLTISSSPSESEFAFTLKIPSPASRFKQSLQKFEQDDWLSATNLSGTFVLPSDKSQKLAFIAGGIGVTPFRSIIKSLVDSRDKRDATLIYSANSADEFSFQDLLKNAERAGIKTHYAITGQTPSGWHGLKGPLDAASVSSAIPDYKQRRFMVSGPFAFVVHIRQQLLGMGISRRQIVTDYFPGYG